MLYVVGVAAPSHGVINYTLLVGGIGLIVPFLVAFLTAQHDRTVQTVGGFVAAGLLAVAAKYTGIAGDIDWTATLGVFVGGGIASGAIPKWITGDAVGRVNRATGEGNGNVLSLPFGRTKEQLLGITQQGGGVPTLPDPKGVDEATAKAVTSKGAPQ
jgi:hypothetical protein